MGHGEQRLRAGTLIEEDLFVTGNFGSKAAYNFGQMKEFFDEHGKKWPLMCMEFWDGWFTRWKEPVIQRDPEELAEAVHEVLELGSINLYMFHGGTNFGFMNGCSARGTLDLPQVTSYDYGALLNEAGQSDREVLCYSKNDGDLLSRVSTDGTAYEGVLCRTNHCNWSKRLVLFGNLGRDLLKSTESLYPKSMEEFGQPLGYLLYETEVELDAEEERLRIIDGRDRVQLFA